MVVLTTFSVPTEGIRHRQPNTTAYVNDTILGKGTLYIAESCLSWACDSGGGFSIGYPNITLHAVSRDLAAFSQECLFLMLDKALVNEETKSESEENGDSSDGSDQDQASTELRFVPDDRGMLDAMFHAMNACQALHPDLEDSISDDDIYEVTDDDDIQMEETDSRLANLNIGVQGEASSLSNRHTGFEVRGNSEQVEGMVEDRVEGRVEDRVEDVMHNRVEVDMEEDKVEVGTGEGEEDSIWEEEGEVVDDNMVEEGRVVDRVVDKEVDKEVGRVVDRPVGQVCRVQGDRSFLVGDTQHQDNMVPLHQGQSPHMASHFSDAES